MGILLYNIHYYDRTAAVQKVLRVASSAYTTKQTDTPRVVQYDDRVLSSGFVERHMFGNGRTLGRGEMAAGDFVMSNKDGRLDYLEDAAFDAQLFEVLWVADKNTAYADAVLLASLRTERALLNWDTMSLVLRDAMLELDIPASQNTFLGTNSVGADVEGTPDDIQGRIKPFVYGIARGVEPVLANTSSLIAVFNFDVDGNPAAVNSISNVKLNYNGAALTLDTAVGTGGDTASLSALAAATIASGKYATCLAKGAIRFNNLAAGNIITADVTEGANSAARTVAQVVKRLIKERAGKLDAYFDSASITALDTAQNAEFGIYVSTDRSVADCMYELLEGAGAYAVHNEQGVLEFGRLEDPSGLTLDKLWPKQDIIVQNVGTLEQVEIGDAGNGIPVWKCITNAQKIYRVFSDNEFAGAVAIADREYAKQQYRRVVDDNIAVLAINPLAPTLEIKSLMDDLADAATENARQFALRNVPRRIWNITVESETLYKLGAVMAVDTARFGLNTGPKKFIVIGYRIQFGAKLRVSYYVWG